MDVVSHAALGRGDRRRGLRGLYRLHYVLFLLATHPKDAGGIGDRLERIRAAQLVEWGPSPTIFSSTTTRIAPTTTCSAAVATAGRPQHVRVSARTFTQPYEADSCLARAEGRDALAGLGCGSGAAADYLASQRKINMTCVTNSPVQAKICRRKFETSTDVDR